MRRIALRAFPWLILILAPIVLLSPVILNGEALFWGTPALQFMPWREFAWNTLRNGRLPLWNPMVGLGAPLFANYQVALAYPLTWSQFILSWLGGIEWSAWWQGVLVVAHWIIAAIGFSRLADRLGMGRLAQAVSGLAFGLGGYLVSRAGFLSINAATAWLPWIINYAGQVSSERLRNDASWKFSLLKLSFVSGMQLLAGHAQTTWYTLLLAIAWSGYWGWLDAHAGGNNADPKKKVSEKSGWVRMRIAGLIKGWLRMALGYVLGAGLAAIQLIPTAEYLSQSQRAGQVEFSYAMTYSFWPWRFLTLLAPDLFGNPVRGDYWGYANFWEDALYIGLLPLLLALFAATGWVFRRPLYRRAVGNSTRISDHEYPRIEGIPLSIVLLIVSFLLALGVNTPIYPWLYRNIPTFDMFQAPTRFSIWAAFALSLLAGYGAHNWWRPVKRALYWTRLATAGAVAVMIGAGLTWYLMGDVSPTFIRAAALAGFWGTGAGIFSLVAPTIGADNLSSSGSVWPKLDSRIVWWHWAVVVFISVDLIAAGWGLNPGIAGEFYSVEPRVAEPLRDMLSGRRLYLSVSAEDTLKYRRFLRFDTFDPGEDWRAMRDVLLPNMNMFDQIASLNNFDPLVSGRYSRWMQILSHAKGDELLRLLDLSAAGGIESLDQEQANGVNFLPLPEQLGKRIRWVPCARIVDDEELALQIVVGEMFDPESEIVVEGMIDRDQSNCRDMRNVGQVIFVDEDPDRLDLRIRSDSPGWLLLSDMWYPGWKAFIDGVETPIYRANYLFRSVPIPYGEHDVIFHYQPIAFFAGALVSIAAWFIFAVLILTSYRSR